MKKILLYLISVLGHYCDGQIEFEQEFVSGIKYESKVGYENGLIRNNMSVDGDQKLQNGYIPIINSEQTWISVYSPAFESGQSFQYTYSEDSVSLMTNNYFGRVQSGQQDGSEPFIEGYYRENDGKVYKKLEDNSNEIIVLDMSLIEGETIVFEQFGESVSLFVVNVDTVAYEDNVPRKRIELICEEDPEEYGSWFWVEGIGQLATGTYCEFDGGDGGIRCLLDTDGQTIYKSYINDTNCWLTTSTNEYTIEGFNIYPNPAQDFINIAGNTTKLKKGVVYDLHGREIDRFNGEFIDISDYASGVYLIEITDNKSQKSIMRFVKK